MNAGGKNDACGRSGGSWASTSFGLIQKAKACDADAWRRLVRLYAPLVYHWCRQSGIPRDDMADLGQEVFAAVARGMSKFRHDCEGDTFRGWLRTITRNRIRNFLRCRAHHTLPTGGSDHLKWLAELAADESDGSSRGETLKSRALLCREAMETVRGEIQEKTWQAFWRTTIDEECATDVAVDLGTTPAAVRMAKARVLLRLRQELGPCSTVQ